MLLSHQIRRKSSNICQTNNYFTKEYIKKKKDIKKVPGNNKETKIAPPSTIKMIKKNRIPKLLNISIMMKSKITGDVYDVAGA